ncbi:TPA: hypothetical protein KDY51_004810 [Vibrio parahaemolyticus]|nr:hypothetical protein [Vibrio parahaemolyticus]
MINQLKNKLKQLALLNAIIEPEWEYRYFSYNSEWSGDEEMASLRDSCGGEWFIWFSGDLVGFKCTSPVDGLVDEFQQLLQAFPQCYSEFVREPAFTMQTGSAAWYLHLDRLVKFGFDINDLPTPETILKMSASDFCAFADSTYEVELSQQIVQSIFDGDFNVESAIELNPEVEVSELLAELPQLGICT